MFLCSHLLHEVQAVSDRVAIVKKGRMVAQGTVAQLLGAGQYLRVRSEDIEALVSALAGVPFVSGADRIDGFVRVAAPVDRAAELNMALAGLGVHLSELSPWQTDLESVFLELTGEDIGP